MAIAAGVAVPAHTVLFGRVINNAAYHRTVTQESDSVSLFSGTQALARSLNTTCSELVEENPLIILDLASSNTSMLLCDNQDQQIFQSVLEYVCSPDSQIQSVVGRLALYYVVMATGLLMTYFLASVFWNVSAYRQTRRIRETLFWSILHQDIGWFDVNEATGINTKLTM